MGLKDVLNEVRWLTEETPKVLLPSTQVMTIGVPPFSHCAFPDSPSFQFFRTYLEEELGFKPVSLHGWVALLSPSKHVALIPAQSGGVVKTNLWYPSHDSDWVTDEERETASKLVGSIIGVSKKLQSASVSLKQVAMQVPLKYRSPLTKHLEDKLKLEVHIFEFAGLKGSSKDDIFVVDQTNLATLKTLISQAPLAGKDPVTFTDANHLTSQLVVWGTEEIEF